MSSGCSYRVVASHMDESCHVWMSRVAHDASYHVWVGRRVTYNYESNLATVSYFDKDWVPAVSRLLKIIGVLYRI